MIAVDTEGVATVVETPGSTIRRQWAEALESGRFRQTGGALKNERGHCCLGVLCELAVEAGVIPPAVEILSYLEEMPTGEYSFSGHDAFLPPVVSKWAFGDLELDEENLHNPRLNYLDEFDEDESKQPASDLNDTYHLDFKEIAQAIRSTFDL